MMKKQNANQIPSADNNSISVRIFSYEKQRVTRKIRSMIKNEFQKQFKVWKTEGQEYLEGSYSLGICEKIQIGKKDEYVSIPISHEGQDGGYLHVYGLREMSE